MKRSIIKLLALMSCAAVCLNCAPTILAQFSNWSGQKIETTLKRKRPPEYFVIGTGVRLQVESQIPGGREFIGLLKARLESGLFAQDSRLRSEESAPETVIVCNITRIDANDNTWEQRTEKEYKKTGQRTEYNEKKRKYETKDDWNYVPVTKRYKIVKGGINISYRA